jgi:hypothetical protein
VRFVVTGIHDRYTVGLQSITKRERRMVQIACGDFNILDFKGPFDEVVIADVSSALIKRDGEIVIIHLFG